MLGLLVIQVGLAFGQPGVAAPAYGSPPTYLQVAAQDPAPATLPPPSALSAPAVSLLPAAPPVAPRWFQGPGPQSQPYEVQAPLLPAPAPAKPSEPATATPEGPVPDRWPLMRELQGTWYGAMLDDSRGFVYGWLEGSANASTDRVSNQPLVWTDRANTPLLQQAWLRFGRAVVTGGVDATFGYQVDILAGSDYRFTLPRGLFNGQLQNSKGQASVYGVDPIQHYVNAYVPTLFSGTEFRVGRLYTPWGVESLEAVSNPVMTRSYAFNWSPPFTHCGAGAYITFSPVWSAVLMAVNGNDVYFGDPSEEPRFVGNVKWTQPNGGQNTVTLATSLGRGKFNPGAPYNSPTPALATEPTGRNNFNAFDLVWTHLFSDRFSYNVEAIYGYQYNVPGLNGDPSQYGFANWAAVAHYLFYTLSPQWGCVLRYENFDDFQGQRTGFKGLYTATTFGVQYKPYKSLWVRPEVRYDYCNDSRPFEGKHDILFVGADLILRY